MDSRNHHFFGDISSFMIRKVVGICPNPDLADIKSFIIQPHIPQKLESARGSFGNLVCEFEKKDGGVCFNISVPDGMQGVFKYNSFSKELVGGEYVFNV